MRTLAVSNYKGGVGKTTTAVNLAAIYAARGLRVLLIDLDPQASATDYFGLYDRAAKDGRRPSSFSTRTPPLRTSLMRPALRTCPSSRPSST